MTYCLGIESTAHTFSASVVRMDDLSVLSNVRDAYTTESGGIVPVELAEHHVDCAPRVVSRALADAGIGISAVSLVAFSHGPGMGHALRTGLSIAKSISLRYDIPLIGVNHCVAHLEVGRVRGNISDPVLLYVSGANTQVIAAEGGRYRVFGETLDLGVGNFLDTIARLLGLGFPGGPELERLASGHADTSKDLLDLPYSVKGMDISLSGMQTRLANVIDQGAEEGLVAYSVQENVFAMLLEVAERALAHTRKDALVLGGGVGCNARLQEMCERMCSSRGVRFFAPEKQFLVDNAAMIAILGVRAFNEGLSVDPVRAVIRPYERTEEFSVPVKDL